MEEVSATTPIIIDLESEDSFSALGQAPIRVAIQPMPKMNGNSSGLMMTTNHQIVYLPEKPIYQCEHCPYSVTEKHLMNTHIKYPNYVCLKLQTMREMKEWMGSSKSKSKKKVKTAQPDLIKSQENHWFCGDCIFTSTELSQMEEHYVKYHPTSAVPPMQSRPTLNRSKEATPSKAVTEIPAAPILQLLLNKSVKRELSKSFVYAPHEEIDGAADSPAPPKKMKMMKPRQEMGPPKTAGVRAPARPRNKKGRTADLQPIGPFVETVHRPNSNEGEARGNVEIGGASDSILTPADNMEPKQMEPQASDAERNREESFYARVQTCSVGRRTVYLSCGDCIYQTNDRAILEEHVKKDHPSSTTALPQCQSRGKWREEWYYYWDNGKSRVRFLFCDVCDFKTTSRDNMEEHALSHISLTTTTLSR